MEFVIIDRTFAGLEARLRSKGWGRFLSAGFLAIWLTGWAAGEVFALWILGVGAWSLLTGLPPEVGRTPLELGPSIAVGVFLLIWIAFWTIGGFAAFRELLRLLWAEDRICANLTGLDLSWRAGWFTRRTSIPRERIRRLYSIPSNPAVMLETLDGAVELTRLASLAERETLITLFTAELKLPADAALGPALPGDWREINAPEGGVLLVQDPGTRRTQARVAWLIALPLGAGSLILVDAATRDLTLIPVALILLAFAAAVTWGACWLQFGRTEWRIEPGRIVQQRRFFGRVKPRFEGTGVVLSETRDSDGDAWYAVAVTAPVAPQASAREQRRATRRVHYTIHDPTEPRRLAEWLAMKARVPLNNMIPAPKARSAEIADLKRQLAATGRVGRAVVWLLDRAGRKPRS